ncbi:McrC family protein [Lentzea sp. NPDC060358]|uniref:McrC family protein n=1 Tax=Lentzea sp. NPDC060358 TaxID=3347103 RepID=UPI00364A9661
MLLVDVREHSTQLLRFDLTEADLSLLTDQTLGKYFRLQRGTEGWALTTRGVTGSLRLDNAVLQVRPKVDVRGDMLLHWLHYATNQSHPTHSRTSSWDTDGSHFGDMVVEALINECRLLLAAQLRKDYQRREAVDGVMRGSLDVAKQATLRFGMIDKLHVRTFDRSTDICENRICGAALRYAARTTLREDLRTKANQLAARFPTCSVETARQTLARVRHNRLNLRYRQAHSWASVVLRSGGVSDLFLPRHLVGESHLLIMHVLWERLVHKMVGNAAVIRPIHVSRPGKDLALFKPDAVARANGGELAVDAKYKDYDTGKVSREDIHQLLTYASAYTSPDADLLRAAIVHPSTSPTARREIRVDFGGRRLAVIDLIGVDVAVRPEDNEDVLRKLLHR